MIGGAFWTPCATILGLSSQNLTQLIKSIFANNEQGFAYDPNDLSTLYQDAAGTIPVTSVGQPVGLILDKSKGLTVGAELNATALPKITGNAPVATYNSTTKVGTVNRVDVSNQSFIILSSAVGGKWYYVSVKNTGLSQIALRNSNNFGVDTTIANISPNGTFIGYVYVATNYVLGIASALGEGTFIVNTVKEIAGNHAYQTVSASRPILQRNATTGAYYLAFDGSDDFLVTNSIDFTATDKVSLFTGVRKLSDAAPSVLVELSASIANVGTFNIQAPRTGNSYGVGVRGSTLNAVDYSTYTAPISNVISLKLTTSATNYLGAIMGRFDGVNTAGSANSSAASIGNYGNYPLYIGRRGGTSLPFNGHLYGLIGIGRLTTDSETAALEKVIAKNTGVTLNV